MEKKLDLSLLATIAAAVFGIVAVGAEWLKSIVNPGPRPGLLMLALSIVVLLLTEVGLSLVGSVIARLIASAGAFDVGFWPIAGLFLQDLALWLTIWILLWGVPFSAAMLINGYLSQFLIPVAALSGGLAVAFAVIFVFRRYFSTDIWAVLYRFWPARQVGNFGMVVGITVLSFPGALVLHRCYVFDVNGAGIHKTDETFSIEVKISGRLIGHDRMRAQLLSAETNAQPPIQTVRFRQEEPGTWVTWFNLAHVRPGFYRIRIFFDLSDLPSFDRSLAKSPVFSAPERQVLLQVTK